MADWLDLADKLAEHARMLTSDQIAHGEPGPPSPPRLAWSRRAAWVAALLAVAIVTALAFGAYRQPELLLNLMGLRYCG